MGKEKVFMSKDKIIISPELTLLLLLSTKEIVNNIDNLEFEKVKRLIKEGISWNEFINNTILHGLTQLVYFTLSKINNNNLIPDYVLNMLSSENQIRKINIIKMAIETDRITRLFLCNNIRFFILKGIPLALSIYNKLYLRESSDLDILIHKDDLNNAIGLLSEEKYIPTSEEFKRVLENIDKHKILHSYHHIDFKNEKKNIVLELHWKLGKEYLFVSLNNADSIFYFDNLWRGRKQIQLSSNKELEIFSPEDQLLYLVYHASGHYYMRLKWLIDIYEIINGDNRIDWDLLMIKGKKSKLLNCFALAVKLCSIYYELDLHILRAKINDEDLNNILDSRQLNKVTSVICNFVILNLVKFYTSEGNIIFNIQKRIYFIKYKLFICNKNRKKAVLFLEFKNIIKETLRKVGVLKYLLRF